MQSMSGINISLSSLLMNIAWMFESIRYSTHLQEQLESTDITCWAPSILPRPWGSENRSVSLLYHTTQNSIISPSLFLHVSHLFPSPCPSLSLSAPLVLWTAVRDAQGLLGKTLNRADRREGGEGKRRNVQEWWEHSEKSGELDGNWIILWW